MHFLPPKKSGNSFVLNKVLRQKFFLLFFPVSYTLILWKICFKKVWSILVYLKKHIYMQKCIFHIVIYWLFSFLFYFIESIWYSYTPLWPAQEYSRKLNLILIKYETKTTKLCKWGTWYMCMNNFSTLNQVNLIGFLFRYINWGFIHKFWLHKNVLINVWVVKWWSGKWHNRFMYQIPFPHQSNHSKFLMENC